MKETLEGMKSLVGIMSSPAVHSQLNVQQPPGLGVPSQYFSSPSSSSCHIGAKLVIDLKNSKRALFLKCLWLM
jgi:hypothetical protein